MAGGNRNLLSKYFLILVLSIVSFVILAIFLRSWLENSYSKEVYNVALFIGAATVLGVALGYVRSLTLGSLPKTLSRMSKEKEKIIPKP